MNPNELKAEIARHNMTIPTLAKRIGIGKKAMYQKISGKTQFRQKEISAIKNALGLSEEKTFAIFLPIKFPVGNELKGGRKMNELIVQSKQLPDNLPDLAAFVLVGREKLTAVRAEIRAIGKLQLAEEVRQQKRDEAQMLSEALLDAEVRIGELTKAIPKATNGGANQYGAKPTAMSEKQKTKSEVITDLGFTPKQVERFEILANNPDVVEEVKREARENDDIPTRTRVIDLVQQRKKAENARIEESSRIYKQFHNGLFGLLTIETEHNILEMLANWIDDCRGISVKDYIRDIGRTIDKLEAIRTFFINYERRISNGK